MKLKIGQKYRVIKDSWENSINHKAVKPGTIVTVTNLSDYIKQWFEDENEHPWNLEHDKLELTGISKSPRQFVLLKDTPDAKKGEIFTQSPSLELFDYESDDNWFECNTVETQPEWFQEIFEEEVKETIKIGKLVYDKKEFEDAVKDLKPIK